MGFRDRFKERMTKAVRSRTSNRTDTANSNGDQLHQQLAESREHDKPPDGLQGLNISLKKVKSRRIEDARIRELWDVAYEKLREEDGALIADYEAKLTGSVTAGVGQTLNLKQNRREWMQTILQNKMDEVNKHKLKLELGNFQAQARDAMQLVLNIVNSANDYIGSAASVNPYTSIAWTGVSFLLPLFMNISEEKTSLARGLDYVASLIAQSQMREELYVECHESASNNHKRFQRSHIQYKTALERLYRQILRFQATTCRYYFKTSVIRHGLDAVKWNDWAPLVDEIREQERNFAAVEEMWREIQRFEERLAVINSFSVMDANLSALANRELYDLLKWLCDIDPSSTYNAARDRHEAGTCEWLIKNSEEFKSWETGDGSLLWLHGKAGSGKSILSSWVIKYLQDRYKLEPLNVVSYFYFSFSDLKKQEVDGMLASLIKQICSHRLNTRLHTPQLIQRLQEYKIKNERPDTETLEAILIDSVSGLTNLYVIIDALDECPLLNRQRKRLLKSLRRILAIAPTNLHVFLTSRKEPDIDGNIRPILSSPDRIEIDLLARKKIINEDIDRYIHSQLSAEDYKSWPESVKEEARKILVEKADCMFQYVRFQLEALQNLSSKPDIQKALQNLPIGLDATYNRILESIDLNFRKQVIHSLKWLAFSRKALRIEELVEIFIIRPHSDITFDETERQFSPTDILKYFSGLIITQEGSSSGSTRTHTEIRLVHFSLKEYLLSTRLAEDIAWNVFSFTEINAHLSIVQSCLIYLNHLSYLNSQTASHGENHFLPDVATLTYPLAEYATLNWMTHLEQIPRVSWSAKVTQDAASALAVHSQSLFTLLKLNRRDYADDESLLKPYFLTAQHGHLQLTEMLINPESGINKYNTREELGEAVQNAALEGNTDMMRSLLKAGADVNAQGGVWGTALEAAARGGHLDALKLLVSSGANVNDSSNNGRCLLSQVPDSAPDCLKFLLDSGADINMQDEFYGTALHKALDKCYDAIFDLLLERGADVNALGKYGTPLQTACRDRSLPRSLRRSRRKVMWTAIYVEELLESGADPNLRGGDYGTALQLACSNSDLFPNCGVAMEIVQLIIENGTVESGTVINGVVIREAEPVRRSQRDKAVKSVYPEAIEVVKLLLDNGAKIDQSDFTSSGTTLLHSACVDRNQESVRWLLDRGADVNAESGKHGTPLQAVLESLSWGYNTPEEKDRFKEETLLIVQSLLSKGALINQVNQTHGTALQTACNNPSIDVEIVRFLLEHGAAVNAEGGKYRTALGAACASFRNQNDLVQLVQLLIKHGANVNANDEKSRAPLTIACGGTKEKLVRLLIESGADVRHQNYAAWYAAAQAKGGVDVLRLLLDQAVDININHVHEEYGTALNVAMENWNPGSERIQDWHDRLSFLLQHGADVDVKGGKFGFPLQTACAPESLQNIYLPRDINVISGRTKFLLEQCPGIDVNAQGGMFGSALQAAAFSGQTESIRLLLDRGANVNARGGKYGSALNAAIIGGYWDIVEILLRAGATPDYRLQQQPDEEWLQRVGGEHPRHVGRRLTSRHIERNDGRGAVARYRKFWEVESGSAAGTG